MSRPDDTASPDGHLALCGYTPDLPATRAFVATLRQPTLRAAAPELLRQEKRDTVLWPAIVRLNPNWERGSQGIGDCVSWGYEMACTTLMSLQVFERNLEPVFRRAATEAIYGGSRVEASGRKTGGWSDGSYGAVAAKWVRDWGVLLRDDYSTRTGVAEHDLREYSSKRAKNWGNWGCGGQDDAGKLDTVAREHSVRTVTLVESFEEAGAAIQNGYPVPVCSNAGFASQRDEQGFVARRGSWSHCMCFIGVRWGQDGTPAGLLCANSWGTSWTGPYWSPPGMPESAAAAGCTAWIHERDAALMLAGGDSFALSDVDGFKPRPLDFLHAAETWSR